MESYYEINVSKNGQHLFATAPRSIKTKTQLNNIYGLFKVKFPESQGYHFSVGKIECVKMGVDMEVISLEN